MKNVEGDLAAEQLLATHRDGASSDIGWVQLNCQTAAKTVPEHLSGGPHEWTPPSHPAKTRARRLCFHPGDQWLWSGQAGTSDGPGYIGSTTGFHPDLAFNKPCHCWRYGTGWAGLALRVLHHESPDQPLYCLAKISSARGNKEVNRLAIRRSTAICRLAHRSGPVIIRSVVWYSWDVCAGNSPLVRNFRGPMGSGVSCTSPGLRQVRSGQGRGHRRGPGGLLPAPRAGPWLALTPDLPRSA